MLKEAYGLGDDALISYANQIPMCLDPHLN